MDAAGWLYTGVSIRENASGQKWIYSTMYTLPYPSFMTCSQDIWLEPNLPRISLFPTEPFHPSNTQAKVLFVIYLALAMRKVFLRKVNVEVYVREVAAREWML